MEVSNNTNIIIDIDYDKITKKNYMVEENMNDFICYILKKEYITNDLNQVYVSILLTNNETIQNINKTYRDKDMETDVISFAYNETENIGVMNVLGDIVISTEKVMEQALIYEHSEEREFYYVLCHGLLHLLGYDHINSEDKLIMRKKEEEILEKYNYSRN